MHLKIQCSQCEASILNVFPYATILPGDASKLEEAEFVAELPKVCSNNEGYYTQHKLVIKVVY